MTDTFNDRDALVEAITREVLVALGAGGAGVDPNDPCCLLYTSPSPRDHG